MFVIADAGYGKTTLLADFSRRTRLRTIWYRLDEDDRDWVGFLAHLVSAGREFDPEFAPRTAAILRSLEPGGPTREDAIETFLEELPTIAADGAALIFDDFHLADEVADIRLIAREIVARGPERLSIVFASRRPPSVPVAKLRSLGELAELGITDLRFSDAEMEQLFRETYGRPLEPDVLTELAQPDRGLGGVADAGPGGPARANAGARRDRSSAACPAPATSSTTTSPRRSSAICPRSSSSS